MFLIGSYSYPNTARDIPDRNVLLYIPCLATKEMSYRNVKKETAIQWLPSGLVGNVSADLSGAINI